MGETTTTLMETRSDVIWRHVAKMARQTADSIEDYSEDVLRVWLERTPLSARRMDFVKDGPVYERMRTNGKKIRRWMSPDSPGRPSIDVEEALVYALPEPYRSNCRRELARRYDLLDVPVPDCAHTTALENMASFTSEVGLVFQRLSPVLSDGNIGKNDREFIPAAITELQNLVAAAEGLMLRLRAAATDKNGAQST